MIDSTTDRVWMRICDTSRLGVIGLALETSKGCTLFLELLGRSAPQTPSVVESII